MKYREVQEHLRALGVVMSKRGCAIRLNHFGGMEDTALYTQSLEEALTAGIGMASPKLASSWFTIRKNAL